MASQIGDFIRIYCGATIMNEYFAVTVSFHIFCTLNVTGIKRNRYRYVTGMNFK